MITNLPFNLQCSLHFCGVMSFWEFHPLDYYFGVLELKLEQTNRHIYMYVINCEARMWIEKFRV